MHRYIALAAGILISIFSLSSFASTSAPRGWYVDGNIGSSRLYGKSYHPGSASRSGFGGGADVGYKFMPYLGLEFGYTIYANSYVTDPTTNIQAAFDRHYSYDAALKGMLPIKQTGIELFGKLGIDQIRSSVGILNNTAASNIGLDGTSYVATGLFAAAGAQYSFSPQMAVNAQFAHANGNSSTGSENLLSAGLSLIFA